MSGYHKLFFDINYRFLNVLWCLNILLNLYFSDVTSNVFLAIVNGTKLQTEQCVNVVKVSTALFAQNESSPNFDDVEEVVLELTYWTKNKQKIFSISTPRLSYCKDFTAYNYVSAKLHLSSSQFTAFSCTPATLSWTRFWWTRFFQLDLNFFPTRFFASLISTFLIPAK